MKSEELKQPRYSKTRILKIVTFWLPVKHEKEIESLIRKGLIPSKSEFIRNAVNDALKEYRLMYNYEPKVNKK